MTIPAKPGQGDAQAAEVIQAAAAAGGAGIRSLDSAGRISILSTIPQNNADAFKARLLRQTSSFLPPSQETTLIEVLIEPPAPSPTP
jgi:hypothetical protein